jgi:chemotaxis protein MotA
MIVVVGIVIVIGAVLAGFTMAGGHVHALVHPSEIVTIGGAALGALVASSPPRVLKDMLRHLMGVVGGAKTDKQCYLEVFEFLYEMFRIARKDGLLAWDSLLQESERHRLFEKYPRIHKNHHLAEFLASALATACDGADPKEVSDLLEAEIHTFETEHHDVVDALTRTADALPGFGIVAAVLGIVITMQAIDGPVEEIGHSVGAALVGTFLGILMSYGIVAPLAGRMHADGQAEAGLLRTVATAVATFAAGLSPKAVLDKARRGISSDCRPNAEEMERLYGSAEGRAVAA